MKTNRLLFGTLLGGASLLAFLSSCSSSKYVKQEVIANSDRTLKTPEWVLSSQALLEEGSNLVYVHKMYPSADVRPDACVSMAKTQATGEMMKSIKTAITSSGQVEDLNGSGDPSYSALTAFLSQGNLSGSKVTETYWEQTMEGDASGMRPVKRLTCAVKVSIDKALLEKQMRDAINGTPGGNPEIRKKLIDAQKNFIDNAGSTAAPVAPAAVTK